MKKKRVFPTSGGAYARTADGAIKQTEKPTSPARGKSAERVAAAEEPQGSQPAAKSATKSLEKARG